MQISANKVVSIDYTLTNAAGEVLDTSSGRGPLAYLQGHQNIIPGLESALEGKQAGESLQVKVAPGDAYGERDEALRQQVPRDRFDGVDGIAVGMRFHAETEHGHQQVVTVVAVDSEYVTVDANHPLAGETLTFDVTIREVREASAEEQAHGHVHGPGGHHH